MTDTANTANTELACRLDRIEALLLGLNTTDVFKKSTVSAAAAVPPLPHPGSRVPQVGQRQAIEKGMMVRYDILAENIKNAIFSILQKNNIETALFESVDFEMLILSAVKSDEYNNIMTSSSATLDILDRNDNKSCSVVDDVLPISSTTTTTGVSNIREDEEDNNAKQEEPTTTTKKLKKPIIKKTSSTDTESISSDKDDKKAEKESKEAQKKELTIMRQEDKETKVYEQGMKKVEKEAQKKAEKEAKEAKEAQKKAEKEAKEAMPKMDKEAKEAQKKAEKEAKEAQKKAEKEAKEAQQKAEKEAKEAQKKAEKEAKEAQKKAEKKSEKKSSDKKEDTKKSSITATTTADDESDVVVNKIKVNVISLPPGILTLKHPDTFKQPVVVDVDEDAEPPKGNPTQQRKSTPVGGKKKVVDTQEYSDDEYMSDYKEDDDDKDDEEEEDEENSSNTVDEDEEDEDDQEPEKYSILTNYSIPSKPEIKCFVLKGQYVYECKKSDDNPNGEIDWSNSVGVLLGGTATTGRIIYSLNYKHYEKLIVKT